MVLFVGCGVDRQAKALRALEKCQYAFVSADSVYLAGTDVNKLVANGRVDISRLPGVALGFLSRDIPLSGILNLRITNPTNHLAGIQRSEEHTSELQSLMRISYAVFCLKKKN